MADNVAITAGTGTTIAADDIGAGVLAQRVKPVWGPDGTGNDTDVATGKPLPVQLRASTGQTLSDTTGILISTTQLSTLGQAAMAASAPVTIASDQTKIPVVGDLAHDAADTSSNPVKQGFKATTALSALTLVSDADRTDGFAGVDGVQIVRPHCNLEGIVTGNATNTDGTSTQCIAAQAAGIKTYLTSIVLCNTSTTPAIITVDIKDGSTTKVSLPLPAGSGCVYNPPIPIPGTAATAWNFDGSAAATTVTCSMVGFKSKV